MVNGVVKWFDAKKGYGFVVSPEVDGDIFVHYTKIQMDGFKKLETSEQITFDLAQGPDGKPQAENVLRQNVAETSA